MKGFEHREKASSGKLAERGRSFRHQNVVSGGKSLGVLARENPPRQVEVLDRICLHQVHPARETQKLLVKSMTRQVFVLKCCFTVGEVLEIPSLGEESPPSSWDH